MATKEFGAKKGTVKVFAFDDLPDTVKGVKEGFIQGIMVQRPVTMGKLAVDHLVAQIDGKETNPADHRHRRDGRRCLRTSTATPSSRSRRSPESRRRGLRPCVPRTMADARPFSKCATCPRPSRASGR